MTPTTTQETPLETLRRRFAEFHAHCSRQGILSAQLDAVIDFQAAVLARKNRALAIQEGTR